MHSNFQKPSTETAEVEIANQRLVLDFCAHLNSGPLCFGHCKNQDTVKEFLQTCKLTHEIQLRNKNSVMAKLAATEFAHFREVFAR